ncbi:hypothetical protein [Bartonella sp. ML70XJBT.G]|uniref:hypothetical protein n=1 Tax=Bartonella sp. ML70XJBT.G TaxID=3019093 RepID=UPI00235DFD91|nr:hypothetical protein [Bartonella sp. ML70XJBT.G]
MKGKNWELDKDLRSFPFEEVFLSWRDYKIIFCICVIFVLCKEILFIPILLEWEFIEWEDYSLFSVFVWLEVITVCVFAFIPVILILYVILGHLLKQNIQKLAELTKQHENNS